MSKYVCELGGWARFLNSKVEHLASFMPQIWRIAFFPITRGDGFRNTKCRHARASHIYICYISKRAERDRDRWRCKGDVRGRCEGYREREREREREGNEPNTNSVDGCSCRRGIHEEIGARTSKKQAVHL